MGNRKWVERMIHANDKATNTAGTPQSVAVALLPLRGSEMKDLCCPRTIPKIKSDTDAMWQPQVCQIN
eukprot:CAMPEP_0174324198 /NCGR_PEP_ID=MMETSP0810-20121108/12329_1 /TAXON_ID=73025 ORGANISM="Eutreptiella gymnastica-like, Strain CCMP1594" /NCGR_SAMPLE_ID=MMETSP0810 /ASSEMBLY_ACC=CAM_ASM_000659 /LENGTH=67 /DNA_ID=CAMNT_0015436909 /DNA_START=1109 /DNA_END=1312 /DNA_ORIENTATION=-